VFVRVTVGVVVVVGVGVLVGGTGVFVGSGVLVRVGVVVGGTEPPHPCRARVTAATSSLMVTAPLPSPSIARQSPTGASPNAMRTPRMISLIPTERSPLQSPAQVCAAAGAAGTIVQAAARAAQSAKRHNLGAVMEFSARRASDVVSLSFFPIDHLFCEHLDPANASSD
jgi:hypothetical protein